MAFIAISFTRASIFPCFHLFPCFHADMVTYANQVLISVLHLSRHADSQVLTLAVSLQCILLWFRLQYFSVLGITNGDSGDGGSGDGGIEWSG